MPKPTRIGYSETTICQTNGRGTLRYCGNHLNLRDSAAADKRCHNVFFNMSCCPARLPVIDGFGGLNDTAKVQLFSELTKKNYKITQGIPNFETNLYICSMKITL